VRLRPAQRGSVYIHSPRVSYRSLVVGSGEHFRTLIQVTILSDRERM